MDKEQWEEKYRSNPIGQIPDPAALLRNNTRLFSGGTALDMAMGMGQNAVFLASHGYDVTGVDRSAGAVTLAQEHADKNGVSLRAVAQDMATFGIDENSYDMIVAFYFLERSLFPEIKKGLKKNGLVFFETYTAAQAGLGGPKNPDFLLKPNELLCAFLDFFIVFYHERTSGGKAIASLIARKV